LFIYVYFYLIEVKIEDTYPIGIYVIDNNGSLITSDWRYRSSKCTKCDCEYATSISLETTLSLTSPLTIVPFIFDSNLENKFHLKVYCKLDSLIFKNLN
jgi:hypothetical protein